MPRPTIPFDYLAVADELHSGRIKVSGEAAAAEYREAGEAVEAELDALLDEVGVEDDAGGSRSRSNRPPSSRTRSRRNSVSQMRYRPISAGCAAPSR